MPGLTRYGYKEAISGFFELPTDVARKVLPSHIEPVEAHHGSSILSVTGFHFTESEVGEYDEVVLGIVVAPLVKAGERLPKFALFPYRIGTSTRAAREHAIERWHLPHMMEDVQVKWDKQGPAITMNVSCSGAPVLELTVTEHSWSHVSHLYQSFMKDADGSYLANITLEGDQSEHEDEKGRVKLHDHPFNEELQAADVYEVPFREIWMRNGIQLFQPLVQLETA
jgi:hypothetical protein